MSNYASEHLKAHIVDLLRRRPMSLAELAAYTAASLPTVRRAVGELRESQWVRPVGTNASTGGRPARLFGLDGSLYMILGIHIEIPTVNIVLTALDGTVLDEYYYDPAGELLPEAATQAILSYAREIPRRFPQRVLLGAGVAVPGYIDAEAGHILVVGRVPGWENYPVRSRLEAGLNGLPIVMENDFDCWVRAETSTVVGRPVDDLIYLGVLEGVKVSMLLNGQIYGGPFGNAGLIGRTRLASCSGSGTDLQLHDLEDTVSIGGLCRIFDRRLAEQPEPDETLLQIASISDRRAKVRAILKAADEGEPLCADIIHRMLQDLSLAVSNLIYILQPSQLVIGGVLSNMPAGLQAELESAIRSRLVPLLSNHLVLTYARTAGRYAAAIGAVHLFMQHYTTLDTAFAELA